MLLEEKIPGFNHLAGLVKDFCLKLLSNSYSNQSCQIGSNGGECLSERESSFMVKISEFDDERLFLIKKDNSEGGYPYVIVIETNGDYTSSYEIGLMLDDLEENLPTEMIEDLNDEFFKFTKNFIDD